MTHKNQLSDEVYRERTRPKDYGVRGDYFRDQTAIIHSMPFRRLKKKTQVFFAPQNDHVCTRIEHVMHVATIAATICKGLINSGWDLDIDLAYAIGLGHDLGHAPFGHAGETTLNGLLKDNGGFIHEINSYRTVEYIANSGKGLNLTYAVKDGIICHNGEDFERELVPVKLKNDLNNIVDRKCVPSTYEGCIVRFADKIAYLGRDIEDAIIAKLIKKEDVPLDIRSELGSSNGEIIDTLVDDLINYSMSRNSIGFSEETHQIILSLKKFNYEKIYQHIKIEEYKMMGQEIIKNLFYHFLWLYNKKGFDSEKYISCNLSVDKAFGLYMDKMSSYYKEYKTPPCIIIGDYIAGMTDEYALDCIKQIIIPEPLKFGINIDN